MVFTVYFLILAIVLRNPRSAGALLALEMSVSAFLGFLIGKTASFSSPIEICNSFFTLLLMTLVILPFRKVTEVSEICTIDKKKTRKLARILFSISIIVAIINGYVLLSILRHNVNDIEVFKNSGEIFRFTYTLPIKHVYITIASLLAPFSYYLIPLAFYFSKTNQKLYAAASIVLSLNIPIFGFTMFSRSYTVMYLALVAFYYLFSRKLFERKAIRKLEISLLVIVIPCMIYFSYITGNRFASYAVNNDSMIGNPVLYSIFDYLSQWNENGVYILSKYYSIDSIQLGGTTNTLLPFLWNTFARMFGLPPIAISSNVRIGVLPAPYYYSFNGLIANWVFDFGYILTFAIAMVLNIIVRYLAPVNGRISIVKYMCMGIVITIPMLSIFGNYLAVVFYNLMILYFLPIGLYLRNGHRAE